MDFRHVVQKFLGFGSQRREPPSDEAKADSEDEIGINRPILRPI